ncbi:bifunctional DNA primase/polymerase [Bifidobacterium aerophilum]|nr:bifunctional DNA primase/polymerase [Bifidobacterium aerophilum]
MSETIFGTQWPIYHEAGWLQMTILPHKGKQPPRKDTTGHGQKPVDANEYRHWSIEEQASGRGMNIGLVMPQHVIALDVDSEDGHRRKADGYVTLIQKEQELGTLPTTWTSGHGDPSSPYRHRLYQVPAGVELHAICEGVDVIQWFHRYLTAPPSIHPNGERYYWLRPDGTRANEREVPRPEELPMLPEAWIQVMSRPTSGKSHNIDGHVGPSAFPAPAAASPRSNERPCAACRSVLEQWRTNPCHGESSRHDGTRHALSTLAFLDKEGHLGAMRIADAISDEYPALIADRADNGTARREVNGMRTWAWSHTTGSFHLFDPCRTWRPDNPFIITTPVTGRKETDDAITTIGNDNDHASTEQTTPDDRHDTEPKGNRSGLDRRMRNLVDGGLDDYDAILIENIRRYGWPINVPISPQLIAICQQGGKLTAGDTARVHARLERIRTRDDMTSPIQ